MKPEAIYFDLDGTLYDLYSIPNWLLRLLNNDPLVYYEGHPKVNMQQLNMLLRRFTDLGVTIGIISWCAKEGTYNFNAATRAIKKTWIRENVPCVSEIHVIKYGTPKQKVAKYKNAILVDDNSEVLHSWNGYTINARKNILEELEKCLDKLGKN